VHRHTDAERDRGDKLLAEVRDVFRRRGHNLGELPIVNVYLARERARRGDHDDAIALMRAAVDDLFRGELLGMVIFATGVLVETLLDRGAENDVAEAEAAIKRLAAEAAAAIERLAAALPPVTRFVLRRWWGDDGFSAREPPGVGSRLLRALGPARPAATVDIWRLRFRALLARAHGDAEAYAHLRDRYRDTATMLGFEGHIAWAEAMP
jgi:hypothetical protein